MNALTLRRTACRLALAAFALVLGGNAFGLRAQDGPIYEVRDYHIAAESIEDYKNWAMNHGVPHLKQKFDVVGFWVDVGIESEVRTETPDPLGSGNVTWIIRWESMDERAEKLGAVFGSPEWGEIFGKLPGGLSIYNRIESRFLKSL